MDVLEAIRTRRSTRAFRAEPLSDDVIRAVEDAVLHSPSGSNAQDFHAILVRDQQQIRRIRRFAPGLAGTPAAVVVMCSNRVEARRRGGRDGEAALRLINTGIATAYILLATHGLGVGNCPVRSFHRGAVKRLLGLPPEVDPELLIALGYPAAPPRSKKSKPVTEVVSYERYGQR